jgi:hypothetical protein
MHGCRLGRVVPDSQYPSLFRSVKSQGLSDMSNRSRAKDSVLAAAIRDLAWDAANDPPKMPSETGGARGKSPPMRSCGPQHMNANPESILKAASSAARMTLAFDPR